MKKIKNSIDKVESSKKKMKFKWAGALKNLKKYYTSIKLQHLIYNFLDEKYFQKDIYKKRKK